MVILTFLRIFPRIEVFKGANEGWWEAWKVILGSKRIVDFSSKQHTLTTPQSALDDPHTEARLETSG